MRRVSFPFASSVPKAVGVKNAPMPAPAARMRAVGNVRECRLGAGEELVDHAGGHYGTGQLLRTYLQIGP